jgi:hypothetical protein
MHFVPSLQKESSQAVKLNQMLARSVEQLNQMLTRFVEQLSQKRMEFAEWMLRTAILSAERHQMVMSLSGLLRPRKVMMHFVL